MKQAIVIGASSGIGRELGKALDRQGYNVGITARRIELLETLKEELNNKSYIKYIDITDTNRASQSLSELIHKMGEVDLIVISSGVGHINNELDWEREESTINVNVSGVTAMINTSIRYFMEREKGHLVVLSSIACLRGSGEAPAYNASKSFVSNYLEGIRCKVLKSQLDIAITDIRPGLVNTEMAKGEGLFWIQPVEKVCNQIMKSIKKKKSKAYITKRWGVVAILLKYLPERLYYKL